MGKPSRDKGARVERKIVDMLRKLGCEAGRVPLSGAAGGRYSDDVWLNTPKGLIGLQGECKARKNAAGWQTIKGWLGDADFLALVEDRQDPLFVLPWPVMKKLLERL